MKELRGRVAVVTGAASGIGLGMAKALCAEGARVVLADIEQAPLTEATAQLRDSGADVTSVCCDVANEASMDDLRDETLAAYGAVHVLCNNAGVAGGLPLPIWEQPSEEWDWVMGVNFNAVLQGIRRFVPLMVEQNEGGHVVNTASIAGLVVARGIYGVSKHAVVALSEAIYRDMEDRKLPIGVSVLCPGWVNTRIIESERNRPEAPRAMPEADNPLVGQMRKLVEQNIKDGLDPDDVGRQVVDAIHEDRFYILTHDWFEMIESRLRPIIAGSNPETFQIPIAPDEDESSG
ncbi:MAG: SDR family NAD(P)-dependent oxidoreductase [Myxococcota bacterium]|nr:SDR family NAD(P)-dependent oxidoreductase [Myxococcota bacterium]